MSYDLYNLKYELSDREAYDFARKAISYQPSDVNRLVIRPPEKLEHYLAKSVLFYILQEYNHDVLSEFEVVGVGRGDLFDLNTRVQYELETTDSKWYQRKANEKYMSIGHEVIVIDCSELPLDFYQIYMYLQQFVHPD